MARSDAAWIAFKGIRSSDMGLRVAKLPDVPIAGERGKAVEIPGRDGSLWLPDDSFEAVTMKAELELTPGADLNAVANWLTGSGELVLSDMSEYGFRARVAKGFDIARGAFAAGKRKLSVSFICAPFRYQAGSPAMEPITAAGLFAGDGNWPALPAITVYGSGDINLMVNDVSVLMTGVDGHITLDCEAMMAFRDGVNASPKVTLMSDDDLWPRLDPASNRISWSGSVTRVIIEPRWRWR